MTKTVSDRFWQLLEQRVGLKNIYNTKPKTFDSAYNHIQLLIAKTDTKGQIDQLNLLQPEYFQDWSQQAYSLYLLISELGQIPDICNRHFLQDFFTTMKLKALKITEIDLNVNFYFHRLATLDLRNNKIMRLENLPISLRELDISRNQIYQIDQKSFNCPYLAMLNMSYNRIDNLSFSSIPRCAKSILALDASFNNICDLRNCIIDVSNLERIKVISLEGNAIALAKNYRKYVMQELLGRICYLDGGKIDIKKEGEKAQQKRKFKLAQEKSAGFYSHAALARNQSVPRSLKKDGQQDLLDEIEFDPRIKFDMRLSVLSGVSGVSVLEEHLADKGIYKPFEELQIYFKSSAFWISFQNHNGIELF